MTTWSRIHRIRIAGVPAILGLMLASRSVLAEEERDRLTIGTDPATTLGTGVVSKALWVAVAVELPLPRTPLTLEFEPSLYWTKSSGVSILQATVAVAPRLYLRALLDGPDGIRKLSGLYAAVGPAFAYARTSHGETSLSVLAIGPLAKTGYRFRFESLPLYVEPYVGWMGLYGRREWRDADASYAFTNGLLLGCMVGYRF